MWLGLSTSLIFGFRSLIRHDHFLPAALHDFLAILLLLSLIVLPPIWIYTRIRHIRNRKQVQLDRDRFANELMDLLWRAPNSSFNFAFFLRPFFTDDQIAFRPSARFHGDYWRHGSYNDFENILADGLDDWLTVIALGGPDGNGPGRVIIDDAHWKDAALILARAARLILVIPFAQNATRWEIEQLRSHGLLEKTIFVVPPQRRFKKVEFSLDANARKTRDIFEKSRAYFQTCGLEMPDLGRWGGMFVLNNDGSIFRTAPLKLEEEGIAPEDFRRKIEALCTAMQGTETAVSPSS